MVCAELCGIGHSTMRQDGAGGPRRRVRRLARRRSRQSAGGGGAAAAGGDPAAAGKALFTDTGCNACHTLADAGSNATDRPELDDLAADAAKYGKQEGQTPEEYVKDSIEDPDAFVVPKVPARASCPTTYKDRALA